MDKDGRRFGRPPKPYQPAETPAGKTNLTDPGSRNIKAPRGYVQGYNAQAVTNEQQIVIAAEITADSPDFGHFEPMVIAARDKLERVGVTETPRVVVADAGYWHQAQMETVINQGTQGLIPPDALKRQGARPGWDGRAYAFMRRVLETDHGDELYRKRQGMIEPVFGDTKFKVTFDRCGHLMPGSEAEVAGLLDTYLAVSASPPLPHGSLKIAICRDDSRRPSDS